MKTPEQMAEEYVAKTWDGRAKGVPVEFCKKDFLAGYKAAQQWISVKDRLPEIGKEILWYHEPGGEFSVGLLHHNVEQPFFTHWQPLPEPPKEEK